MTASLAFRQPIETVNDKPKPDSFRVLHKGMAADFTVVVVCEGRRHEWTINRGQAFLAMADIATGLFEQEPCGAKIEYPDTA